MSSLPAPPGWVVRLSIFVAGLAGFFDSVATILGFGSVVLGATAIGLAASINIARAEVSRKAGSLILLGLAYLAIAMAAIGWGEIVAGMANIVTGVAALTFGVAIIGPRLIATSVRHLADSVTRAIHR